MKPLVHATISAKKFGGLPEDYQEIHDFFDWPKIAYPHMKHRAILHNSFGIYMAERLFGTFIVNSDGDKVSVRDVAEQHVLDDLGRIPTIQDWLEHLVLAEPWMRADKKTKFVKFDSYVPGELNDIIPKGVQNDSLVIELTEEQKATLEALAKPPVEEDLRKVVLDGARRFRASPGVTAREVDDGSVRIIPDYGHEANTD